MQVYKVPKLYVIYDFALAGIITFGGLVMGLITMITDKTPGGQIRNGLFLTAWIGICSWVWYRLLCKVPLEVGWRDEGFLVFRSVMGSAKVAVNDIISIKEESYFVPRSIKVKHTQGTIKIYGRLNGFEELLDRVIAINPTVELSLFFGH